MPDQTNPLREALRYAFRKDGTVTNGQAEDLADRAMKIIAENTPSSRWAAEGKPDPHGTVYDCERAALAHGDMTDDELANAVFLYDHRRGFESIGLLTAAKDRIRWLSRRLPVVDDATLSRAARALCDRHADACQVHRDDCWKTYSAEFIADAKVALTAAAKTV